MIHVGMPNKIEITTLIIYSNAVLPFYLSMCVFTIYLVVIYAASSLAVFRTASLCVRSME